MKPFLPKLAIIGCCLLFHATIRAQTAATITVDNIPIDASPTQEQEPIYRGSEYARYANRVANGSAYFKSEAFAPGKITYYNRTYNNVPLLYDQVNDEIVTYDLEARNMIRLYNPEVKQFTIHGTNFVYFTDTVNAEKQGFWQVLANGNATLYKREFRVMEERVKDSRIVYYIRPNLYYYVLKSGRYEEIDNKKAIIELFADKKQELQAFLKSNRRRFRRAGFEETLKASTIHYNELTAAK